MKKAIKLLKISDTSGILRREIKLEKKRNCHWHLKEGYSEFQLEMMLETSSYSTLPWAEIPSVPLGRCHQADQRLALTRDWWPLPLTQWKSLYEERKLTKLRNRLFAHM